ncbi:porphobilinogen synthase [Candidatus Bathyarchaeota archaeon]|nr:porphobilinogen synthase [Candidatus Bathyarchaeota archaeon]
MFPHTRMRRMRRASKIRDLVKGTSLTVNDLIYPVFIKEGISKPEPIDSMPGQYRLPMEDSLKEVEVLTSLKVPSVILFGIPKKKDATGSEAYRRDGVIQSAVKEVKSVFGDKIAVITDVCLCQYTDHGHCGLVKDGEIVNDETLRLLTLIAVSHAEAGADIVAPSAMMDGQVQAIREGLDSAGYSNVAIMAYSAKHASCFYGPFRDAAYSRPVFGDRQSYQMDYSNSDEALREVELDIDEGADIVMVKPALAYLDLIYRVKTTFRMPTAAYNVSGEYSMIKAAGRMGWLDEKSAALEVLTAIKRAGADMILTYFAKEAAEWLSS